MLIGSQDRAANADVTPKGDAPGFVQRQVPIIWMDARHANAALKMRPVKTDRNDAAGLAQIVRTGWFKQVRIKSRSHYQIRSLLTALEMLGARA